MEKLKYKELKMLREQLLIEQNHTCVLCNETIEIGEAVLDHCHQTGHIRQVIHRGCNLYLGKLENNLKRNRITPTRLHNILKNLENYIVTKREEIHPMHSCMRKRRKKLTKTK